MIIMVLVIKIYAQNKHQKESVTDNTVNQVELIENV